MPPAAVRPRSTAADDPARLGWIERIGLAAVTLKLCLAHYLGILRGRERLDLPMFAAALRQAGLSILPAITLVTAAAGLILGQQAARVLQEFSLPSLVLLLIAYAVIMELIPLLVGIMVAARGGIALAVRQATLLVSGQMDGLLVSGVNPIVFTTAPALLAMLLMSFAFVVWGSLVTLGTALAWLLATTDVDPADLLDALRASLTPADLLETIGKSLCFALLIALIATTYGSSAGRDPEGISDAATGTMIAAVTTILLVDLLFVLWPARW